MSAFAENIVTKLLGCLPQERHPFALHEPYFHGNEREYLCDCIDTGWVSSVGKYVDNFEHNLAEYTGAKHAVVVVNGTAALQISYLLAGVQRGDEVLAPALTFVATCNALAHCGAIPHFVDSESVSFGVDAEKLSAYLQDTARMEQGICYNKLTNRPIRALCVTHIFGHPADIDPLNELCERYNLALIEDAAEALGSFYKGIHVGHRGAAGILSFNGNKSITTGGGGAIITDNKELAARAKYITTTAKSPHPWLYQHTEIGYNYRMPNINAALGCAQLEQITDFLAAKRDLANHYRKIIADIPGIEFFNEPEYAKSNYWLNAFSFDQQFADERDSFLDIANKSGFGVRPVWELMHTLPMFADCPRMDLTAAENLVTRSVNIPSSVFLRSKNEKA